MKCWKSEQYISKILLLKALKIKAFSVVVILEMTVIYTYLIPTDFKKKAMSLLLGMV